MTITSSLSTFLKAPNNYTKLCFTEGSMRANRISALAEGLKSSATLTSLDLQGNQIGAAEASALAEGLKTNATLTLLKLQYNQIGDAGASALAEGLKTNATLTSLGLSNNQIGDAGASALAEGLKTNATLTSLGLSNNQIGDAGASALAEGLKTNATLTSLHLSNKQIGDTGASALAEGLKTNATLTSLHLSNKQIGDTGASALAEGLKTNATLTLLNLRDNQIGRALKTTIEYIVAKNKKLAKDLKNIEGLAKLFVIEDVVNFVEDEEIAKLSDLMQKGNERLQGESQRGILLMGNTGAGKSSLAHLLTGQELQAIFDDEIGALVIDAMEPLADIIISHNKKSETKIPNKCLLNEVTIWDCPGFQDTDITQEIANAFYIKKLCDSIRELKILLVVTDSEIAHNRGTSFVAGVHQLVNSFNDLEPLNASMSLIATHVPSGKQVKHIENSIGRIIEQNEQIPSASVQMIKYLSKSIQLFPMPINEGKITFSANLLTKINDQTEYCDHDSLSVNMSLSKEALSYSAGLLNQTSNNCNKLLGIIAIALIESANSTNENNLFTKHYSLIENLVPTSVKYIHSGGITFRGYWPDIKQNEALLKLFSKSQDSDQREKATSFEDDIQLFLQALEIFKEFSQTERHANLLQKYEYSLQQQIEYSKFLSEICKKELPATSALTGLITKCTKNLEHNLQKKITSLILQENQPASYYEEALTYLNMHADEKACKLNKAKIYVELGGIAEQDHNPTQVIKYYLEAIKCHTELPAIYNSLGVLFYERGDYQQAIECFKVTNNAFEIKICFKEWLATDPRNPTIRAEKADYYASIGLQEKAQQSYHDAFSLSQDQEIKKSMLHKIADILKQENLEQHFREMADADNYYNFDIVNEQFIELIGEAVI